MMASAKHGKERQAFQMNASSSAIRGYVLSGQEFVALNSVRLIPVEYWTFADFRGASFG
jgi:hypothetical protein